MATLRQDAGRISAQLAMVDVRRWLRFGKPSALGAVTGMVAGSAITPAGSFVRAVRW
jgi:ammonia channel protein AmtB